MSTPATRIVSVIPALELELDGQVVTLKYTHAALHAAGANPYNGDLGKLCESLTPQQAVKFIQSGMDPATAKEWTIDRLNGALGPTTVMQVIGDIAQQFAALAKGADENPPQAAA